MFDTQSLRASPIYVLKKIDRGCSQRLFLCPKIVGTENVTKNINKLRECIEVDRSFLEHDLPQTTRLLNTWKDQQRTHGLETLDKGRHLLKQAIVAIHVYRKYMRSRLVPKLNDLDLCSEVV